MQTLKERWEELAENMPFDSKEDEALAMHFFYLGHRSMLCFVVEAQPGGVHAKEGEKALIGVVAEIKAFREQIREEAQKEWH